MRIAIVTLPFVVNYGGVLQCYALQTALERLGHGVCVLQRKVPASIRARLMVTRWIKTYLLKIETNYYGGKTDGEIVGVNFQAFIRKHIRICYFRKWQTISGRNIDAIVAGSDQIWRNEYFKPIKQAYLDFAKKWKGVKRVAYAASFGIDEWDYTPVETKECAELCKLFDAVSVREASGIDLCREYLGVDAVQCLDPTLLLTAGDYVKLLDGFNAPAQAKCLACYFLDETKEKEQLAVKIAEEKGLNFVKLYNPDSWTPGKTFEERLQLPIERWIAGFRDAEFVVTDSFHGCVFSIIFNKPFVVVGNTIRGMARFRSLLSMFHLEGRLVMPGETEHFPDSPIRWEEVNEVLERERENALSFLTQNLH